MCNGFCCDIWMAVTIWRKQLESRNPPSLESAVQEYSEIFSWLILEHLVPIKDRLNAGVNLGIVVDHVPPFMIRVHQSSGDHFQLDT